MHSVDRLPSLPACHYGKLHRGRTIGIQEREIELTRNKRVSKNSMIENFFELMRKEIVSERSRK